MGKGEHLERQIYFQNAAFLNTAFARAAIWYLQTSVSPLSGDSNALFTQIRQQLQEQGRKRKRKSHRRKGKMLQFFAQDTVKGNGSFFPTLQKTPKQNGRTHSVRTTSDGRRKLGDRGRKHLDQELSNQVPKANQQLWAQTAPLASKMFSSSPGLICTWKAKRQVLGLVVSKQNASCVQAWRREEATLTEGQGIKWSDSVVSVLPAGIHGSGYAEWLSQQP